MTRKFVKRSIFCAIRHLQTLFAGVTQRTVKYWEVVLEADVRFALTDVHPQSPRTPGILSHRILCPPSVDSSSMAAWHPPGQPVSILLRYPANLGVCSRMLVFIGKNTLWVLGAEFLYFPSQNPPGLGKAAVWVYLRSQIKTGIENPSQKDLVTSLLLLASFQLIRKLKDPPANIEFTLW